MAQFQKKWIENTVGKHLDAEIKFIRDIQSIDCGILYCDKNRLLPKNNLFKVNWVECENYFSGEKEAKLLCSLLQVEGILKDEIMDAFNSKSLFSPGNSEMTDNERYDESRK